MKRLVFVLQVKGGAKGLLRFQRPAGSLVHAAAIVLWGAEVKSCVPVWVNCVYECTNVDTLE